MKKLILSAGILLAGCASFGQTKISEGTITYAVEYELPENLKPYAAFFPKEATVYFRGDSTLSVQKSTGRVTSVLLNPKTDYMKLLLEVQGKNYVVNYSPADMEEMQMSAPEYTYTAAGDVAVGTYKATRYTLKDAKGVTTEAVFTKDFIVPKNSMSAFFNETYGTPLSFTVNQSGLKVKATFKDVKAEPVPKGTFAVPKGYETLTMQQLKAMNGGK